MGVTRDEIDLFRRARPEAPAYDPAAKARLRAALAAQDVEENPVSKSVRRPVRRFVAVGALTAAAVVGVTVVQNVEWGGAPQPGRTGATGPRFVLGPVANAEAGRFADRALRKANDAPATTPRPDQWGYVKTVVASSSRGVGGRLFGKPDRRMTIESWRRMDNRQKAVMVNGKLFIENLGPPPANPGAAPSPSASPSPSGSPSASPGPSPSPSPSPGADGPPTVSIRTDYPFLLSLPVDPQALFDKVKRMVEDNGYRDATPDQRNARLFQVFEMFMREVPLPLKTRAAMYGALAKIPGIRYEPRAADIAGRPGVTFYMVTGGDLRTEILVDPVGYDYLGHRTVAVKPRRTTTEHGRVLRDEPGTVLGWGGRVAGGIVDRAGQRP